MQTKMPMIKPPVQRWLRLPLAERILSWLPKIHCTRSHSEVVILFSTLWLSTIRRWLVKLTVWHLSLRGVWERYWWEMKHSVNVNSCSTLLQAIAPSSLDLYLLLLLETELTLRNKLSSSTVPSLKNIPRKSLMIIMKKHWQSLTTVSLTHLSLNLHL